MSTTITSRCGGHCAVLSDDNSSDGGTVTVELWQLEPRRLRLGSWRLECSWHRACDLVYDLVWPLPDAAPRFVWDSTLRRVIDNRN